MLEVLCYCEPWNKSIALLVANRAIDGSLVHVGANVTMVPHEEDGMVLEPTVRLKPEAAQRLMDELWQCGLRPTEGTGSAGSLAATERHLKDMQSIAMGLLRGDLKGTA